MPKLAQISVPFQWNKNELYSWIKNTIIKLILWTVVKKSGDTWWIGEYHLLPHCKKVPSSNPSQAKGLTLDSLHVLLCLTSERLFLARGVRMKNLLITSVWMGHSAVVWCWTKVIIHSSLSLSVPLPLSPLSLSLSDKLACPRCKFFLIVCNAVKCVLSCFSTASRPHTVFMCLMCLRFMLREVRLQVQSHGNVTGHRFLDTEKHRSLRYRHSYLHIVDRKLRFLSLYH